MSEEMNLKVDLSRLSKEERDEFKRLTEKASRESRVWKPKYGEHYFTIDADTRVIEATWRNATSDKFRWATGLVFKTQEEAEFALGKMMVKTELERYAREHNDPSLEEWNTYNNHYFITCDTDASCLEVSYRACERSAIIYFTSKEIAEDAIKEIGEQRIIKYLFGVDCEEDE